MSGIFAVAGPDGTVPERFACDKFLLSLAFRGPDGQRLIVASSAALGHALLRTQNEAEEKAQPLTLDGNTWITADARLDGRKELTSELERECGRRAASGDDAELILLAYKVWGERCAEHLLGDFAFVLWDGKQRLLFCARDILGVKPLYYAEPHGRIAITNTLHGLLTLRGVSSAILGEAVGDFLLTGLNQSLETTFFRDIRRLPPGHALLWQEGKLRIWQYGKMKISGPLQFGKRTDCAEEFCSLLQKAVKDRLRGARASIFLSGGLDSTSVAATAHEVLLQDSKQPELKAFTATYEKLFDDNEGRFAELTAESLGIPLQVLSGDGYSLFERAAETNARLPEPADEPLAAFDSDFLRAAASHARVALAGEGGDIGLHPQSGPYLAGLIRSGRWVRAVADVAGCFLETGKLPPLLIGLRNERKNRRGENKSLDPPNWIDPEFARQWRLAERWGHSKQDEHGAHPFRPAAYSMLSGNFWPSLFESTDSGATGIELEVRYPYMDLRLLNWLLSLPPLPWCIEKRLTREAMKGKLPEAVRLRPKTPLAMDPVEALIRKPAGKWQERFELCERARPYFLADKLFPIRAEDGSEALFMKLRAVSLIYWLQMQG